MAVTQYVGSRYVPVFADPAEWSSSKTYEPLTIVTHEGNSYTSKQFVPVGVQIDNETFWAITGNYNAQIEQYRRDVAGVLDTIEALDTVIPGDAFSQAHTVADAIEENADEIKAVMPFSAFSASNTIKSAIDFQRIDLINVDNYGADPTGETDSSAAFQAAINYAITTKTNGIYVGNGNYRLDNTIIVNGPLGIYGNMNAYPCEFWPSGTRDLNSFITCNAATAFDVVGYDVNGAYWFAPVCLQGVYFLGNNENTLIDYRPSEGPTRPSKINNCHFAQFNKIFDFKSASGSGTMFDFLHVDTSVFRNGNYLFYAEEYNGEVPASLGGCLFTSCVCDNFFGMFLEKVHGCIRFINTLLEGAVRDTLVDIKLGNRGSVVFDGCYFEGNRGHINITGTVSASALQSTVEIRNTSSYAISGLTVTVDTCLFDMDKPFGTTVITKQCNQPTARTRFLFKGSCGVIRTAIPNKLNMMDASGNLAVSGHQNGNDTYTKAQLGTNSFTLSADSDLIIYGFKGETNIQNFLLDDEPIDLKPGYNAGMWYLVLDNVPAGEHTFTFDGSSSRVYYGRVNHANSAYVAFTSIGV